MAEKEVSEGESVTGSGQKKREERKSDKWSENTDEENGHRRELIRD